MQKNREEILMCTQKWWKYERILYKSKVISEFSIYGFSAYILELYIKGKYYKNIIEYICAI